MKRTIWVGTALLAFATVVVGLRFGSLERIAAAQSGQVPAGEVPMFQVDPSWPKLPSKWVFGYVSGITVDAQDHIWVLHRPRTIKPEHKGRAAPPVLEFDAAGNFIQGWGGPGEGYEWFSTEHGVSIDQKGFVWLTGSGTGGADPADDHILKFTKAGKFVLQIGRKGQSKGNTDPNNVHGAADVALYPKTNEIFVADGYGNKRVIVFDADTGKFKRMWSAFGNPPTDQPPAKPAAAAAASSGPPPPQEGPGAQFDLVHAARVSNDGLVYVCDRSNRRLQVFTPDGKFVTQLYLSKDFNGPTASRTAFSPDPEQRILYVIDRSNVEIVALERKTLRRLGSFGGSGCPITPAGAPGSCETAPPGKFGILHDIATDSKGNIYTAESLDARRAQKLVFKGMSKPAK